MGKSLTITRSSTASPIIIPMMIFNPDTEGGVPTSAMMDTGCDHTCITEELAAQIGIQPRASFITVQGVSGLSNARTAIVTLGIQMDDGHKVQIGRHEVGVLPALGTPILLGRELLAHFDVHMTHGGLVTIRLPLAIATAT